MASPSQTTSVTTDPRVSQIDDLERQAAEARDKALGDEWQKTVEALYTLTEYGGSAPIHRPKVCIPQLQTLMMNEAVDVTDNDPRVIILKKDGTRDTDHEDALMAQWKQGFWNNQILLAILWAEFAAVGYLQVGFDPSAGRGKGRVWVRARDPRTVFADPNAKTDEDLQYVILRDEVYIDEVRKCFPERGWLVKPGARPQSGGIEDNSGYKFQLPDGPMSVSNGMPSNKGVLSDGKVTLRYLFCRDYTLTEVKPSDDFSGLNAVPTYKPKYPNGRLIVECEGVVLFDGDNPTPLGMFPIVSLTSMPRLMGYYPPSAVRYSVSLQELAERMMTQIYENAVRLNNGIVIINDQAGINVDEFGGLPGELHVTNGNVPEPIKIVYPTSAFPAQMVQLPQNLLELQRVIQGFTPARSGEAPAGNVSQGLYDMSVQQSQKLTRMRGRLMAEAVQRMSELAFYFCAKFYTNNCKFPVFQQDADMMLCDWNPLTEDQYSTMELHVDPASIAPISATAMRMIAPVLRQEGALDVESFLSMMDVPGAKEIAAKVTNEQKLAALSALTKRGK